jgi:polysaccharide biosynthesis transport protein
MSIAAAPEQLAPPAELNIKDYLDVVRRRKAVFIQVFIMVLAVGLVATALSKPVYQTTAKLTVPMPASKVDIMDVRDPIATIMGTNQPDPISAQMEAMQSREFLQAAKEKAGTKTPPGVIPPSVKVEAADSASNVIRVKVEGGDPEAIAKLAEAVVDLHIERTSAHASSGLIGTTSLVSRELDKAKRNLKTAEQNLMEFQKQYRLAQLSTEQEARNREHLELQSKMRSSQSNVTAARAQILQLEASLKNERFFIYQDATKENTRKSKFREKLDELEYRRAELELQFKPDSRQVRDVRSQIARLQDQIGREPDELPNRTALPNPARATMQAKLAELQTTLLGYQTEYNAAAAQFNGLQRQGDNLAALEVQQTALTRERDLAQSSYMQLTGQLQNLRLREQGQKEIKLARKIEGASVPTQPIRPKKAMNVALSVLLALFLAAGMAFLQEYLDDRVNSPEDIERISALPTLGHVPLMASEEPRLVSALPANSHVAEAYRTLRSSIGFAGIDTPIRRLQVTSASKGEGKSTTAVNLATAMAMDGKRVILVDADLRRPNVHRLLNVPNSPGLSEVLVGMKPIDEVIQDTDVENLRVISAGPIPPNPAELLGSRAFDLLVEQVEERADVVIFDTPPCLPVSDPLIVASRMDGVVMVLYMGQTKKAAIKYAIEMLTRARARIVGVVFNQVSAGKGGSYHQFYYYYGDGYYADTADRGDRHRRNGKRKKLASGKSLTTAAHSRNGSDDEA